jgi:eukaryotic-like serine/threonine-protein kinase
MLPYPLPHNEAQRLTALTDCAILDTPPERIFDDVVQLASQLCGTPIALVSLIDRSRQWFKARVGLDVSETPRGSSLCAYAIVEHGPLIVRDALRDPRFADHPLVTGPTQIRFYAAVPLVVEEDCALGTVCVMDHVARDLTSEQLEALKVLARRTSAELSLRQRLAKLVPEASATRVDSSMNERRSYGSHARSAELPVGAGEVVGERYRIERPLGAGGMGVVAAAIDMRRDVRVAIKFMRPNAAAEPSALRRFVREAQVLFALDSEHITRVLDFGRLADGAPYLVMEYLEGLDLAALLRSEGRLRSDDAIRLVLEACVAVQSAHDQHILHRDLKPANLFLARADDGTRRLKVLDFGISKLASSAEREHETPLTSDATELGSPSYMAPEQMLGAADVDVRCDVYSLGVVLYELLAGHPPFFGPNRIEICANVLTSPPPPLHSLRPELSPAVVALVERCLEKQPERRYESVRALAQALRDLLV